MSIAAPGVTVWLARLDQVRPGWIRYLDPAERRRFDRYRQVADRDRMLLATCLVRALAAARLADAPERVTLDRTCPRCREPHGKVRVVGADLPVSISHSGDWVLVATGREGEVGVDVERVDPDLDPVALAPMTLHPAERAVLAGTEPARRPAAFARYWTRKEAVLKTTGDGLLSPPAEVHVSAPDQPAALVAWPAHPDLVGRLWLADLDLAAGYAACVAATGTRGEVRTRPAAEVLDDLGV
jgi:4'-phosphopantetheinyl transferase